MSVSSKATAFLIWLYKVSNQIGLMNLKPIQTLYISSYFKYKKYIEDSYEKLAKNYPDFFKGGHILDIGANIGYTSFVFSKVLEGPFKLFAFEPEEKNIQILKKVSKKYCFEKKLIPVATAVGDKNGEIDLWKNDAHNGDHRILTNEFKNQFKGTIKTQKTTIITIDDYLRKREDDGPISFVKIDVQGYELPVCRGMAQTLARNPNMIISLEYCPEGIKSLGFNPHDLIQFFQERNYDFYYLNNNSLEKCDIRHREIITNQRKSFDYLDILCSRKNLV